MVVLQDQGYHTFELKSTYNCGYSFLMLLLPNLVRSSVYIAQPGDEFHLYGRDLTEYPGFRVSQIFYCFVSTY